MGFIYPPKDNFLHSDLNIDSKIVSVYFYLQRAFGISIFLEKVFFNEKHLIMLDDENIKVMSNYCESNTNWNFFNLNSFQQKKLVPLKKKKMLFQSNKRKKIFF